MAMICIIGAGYVGLVTGACFADMGNQVTCVDTAPEKIESFKRGMLPIYEQGLEGMIERNMNAGRLCFTTSYREGVEDADFIFITVNTPTSSNWGGSGYTLR